MEQLDLSNISGNCSIRVTDDYVVLCGKAMWVYKHDGTLVYNMPDAINVTDIVFLSGDRLLICGGKGSAYRMISLRDGIDLWVIPIKKLKNVSPCPLVVSPDNKHAFHYYSQYDGWHLVQIDLRSGMLQDSLISMGLRSICDLICDEKGQIFLLETHYDETPNGVLSQNGIRILNPSQTQEKPVWKYRWQHEGAKNAKRFFENSDNVLTNDLQVYEPATGSTYRLLENDQNWVAPGRSFSDYWIDQSKRYITLKYIPVNVVVDRHARQMIARYAGRYTRGCIVGEEYWISSDEGIRRLPFPLIEAVPKAKPVFWHPHR